jgi:hypothetical protein
LTGFRNLLKQKIMKNVSCRVFWVTFSMIVALAITLGVGFGSMMPNLKERSDHKSCFIVSKKIEQTQCCEARSCQCLECERSIPFCSTLTRNKTEGTCCGGLFCCTWLCQPGVCSCFESVHHQTCKSVCKNCTLLYLEVEFSVNRTQNDTVTQMAHCLDTNCTSESYNKYRVGSTYRCWADNENNDKNYKVSFNIPTLNTGAVGSFTTFFVLFFVLLFVEVKICRKRQSKNSFVELSQSRYS